MQIPSPRIGTASQILTSLRSACIRSGPALASFPEPTLTSTAISYVFTQPADVDDVTFRAETSTNLAPTGGIAISAQGSGLTHRFLPATSRLFTRVKILVSE